jgi:hypothetical protein
MLPLLYCTHTVKSNHLAKPRPSTYLYTLSRYYMSKLLIDCYCKLRKKACFHIRVEIANRSAGQSPFPESGVIVMTVVSPNQWPCFSASQSRTDTIEARLPQGCPQQRLVSTPYLLPRIACLISPPSTSTPQTTADSVGQRGRSKFIWQRYASFFILLIRLSACKK